MVIVGQTLPPKTAIVDWFYTVVTHIFEGLPNWEEKFYKIAVSDYYKTTTVICV